MRIHVAVAAAAVLLTIPAPAHVASQRSTAEAANDADRCSAMVGRDFGERVQILSARHVPAGPSPDGTALPAHCLVEGMINSRTGAGGRTYGIGFAIGLPDEWTGRFLLQGGGGLNGSIPPPIGGTAAGDVPALARGFAVLSHDSGHKGEGFDASFMADQRAALDFAESSVRTVAELGKRITASYYEKPIARSYMAGCSTGGRESMLAAQRYPELFDGIVVGAPAMRTGYSNLAIAFSAVQFNQAAPRDAAGKPIVDRIFSAADRRVILKGMLDQCDALDGLADGLIMNVAQCQFKPAKLQCRKDEAEDCLGAAQVTAMERAFAGPKDKAGYPVYVPMPYDVGIVETEGWLPGYLPTGKPGVFGPATRDLTIDLDARIESIRRNPVQRLTDTDSWTNLGTFLARGGKILFYHGVSDPWFSALDTWDYWQRAAEANGAAWAEASRFYMLPGVGHCGGGPGFDRFDLLGAVVAWVEEGRAPAAVLASRREPEPAERPMCPHPAYPHYVGGDPRRADSFACRMPS